MKAEITTKKEAFEPIEVKITIESLEELRDLASRLNVSTVVINDHSTCPYGKLEDAMISYDLWMLLSDLYKQRK